MPKTIYGFWGGVIPHRKKYICIVSMAEGSQKHILMKNM